MVIVRSDFKGVTGLRWIFKDCSGCSLTGLLCILYIIVYNQLEIPMMILNSYRLSKFEKFPDSHIIEINKIIEGVQIITWTLTTKFVLCILQSHSLVFHLLPLSISLLLHNCAFSVYSSQLWYRLVLFMYICLGFINHQVDFIKFCLSSHTCLTITLL